MNSEPIKRSDLARLGAENAESAFSLLVDRPVERGDLTVEAGPVAPLSSEWECGVLFELEGDLEAWVALLFRASQRDALIARMLGERALSMGALAVESALMEVANIVASHVATGIADALGQRLLPSVPVLAARDAAAEIDGVLSREGASAERCLCELSDGSGELGGLLVIVSRAAAR